MKGKRAVRPGWSWFFLPVLVLAALPLSAQTPGGGAGPWQQAALADLSETEEKFVALAEAMPQSAYDWRPGEGVRSVAEVFTHIAASNFMIPTYLGAEVPAEVAARYPDTEAYVAVTEKQEVVQLLRDAFAHAREAVTALSTEDMDAPVRIFGRDAARRDALLLLLTHNHEHLGQAIAYARTNQVVPPWSDTGD